MKPLQAFTEGVVLCVGVCWSFKPQEATLRMGSKQLTKPSLKGHRGLTTCLEVDFAF